jgi:hypothetical protein
MAFAIALSDEQWLVADLFDPPGRRGAPAVAALARQRRLGVCHDAARRGRSLVPDALPRLRAIVGDRAYRGLERLASRSS